MFGHASATMTLDVYADLFPDDLDGVAAAPDFAEQRYLVIRDDPTNQSDGSGRLRRRSPRHCDWRPTTALVGTVWTRYPLRYPRPSG